MAAGEDQAEAIVFDFFICNLLVPAGGVVAARFQMGNKIFLYSIETRAPAHGVDGLEARLGNKPRAWLVGNASEGPGFQSCGERLVHRFFGQVQISEKAHERG
jgi:hypothetical protein